jgi:CheY-like chemotaxis protein
MPLRQPLVLVVDDEPAFVQLATRALEPAGYRVLAATSGVDALQVTASLTRPLDLLLTDLEMPEMSGRSLASELRKKQGGLKVLYLTGHSDALFGHASMLDLHEAFIEKPISGPALREAVALHLFGTRRAPQERGD